MFIFFIVTIISGTNAGTCFDFQADENSDKDRRRQEIRERLEAEINASTKNQQKQKKGFMTPERKKRLRVSKNFRQNNMFNKFCSIWNEKKFHEYFSELKKFSGFVAS